MWKVISTTSNIWTEYILNEIGLGTREQDTTVNSNRHKTIRYDSVYLVCSKKLTGSQLSPPHGTNKKLECETKNKMMSVISPVQTHYHERSPCKLPRSECGSIIMTARKLKRSSWSLHASNSIRPTRNVTCVAPLCATRKVVPSASGLVIVGVQQLQLHHRQHRNRLFMR